MNRFVLSAKSLVSTSWLVRSALILFALISLLFAVNGQAIGVVILFFCLLAGAGYTSRTYLRSERRRLVPGMNESCAAVSITLLLVAWSICSLLTVSLHGFSPEAIGGCFCGLAFALWVGCFESASAPFLFLPYFLPMLAVAYKDQSEKLFDSYAALPQAAHVAVGAILFAAGVAIVARYWFIITSKYSPLVYCGSKSKKAFSPALKIVLGAAAVLTIALPGISILSHLGFQRPLTGWGEALGTCGLHTLISFTICGILYALWRGLIQYLSPTGRNLTDLGHFLFGQGSANTWKMLPWAIGGVFLVSFAATRVFVGAETDEAIHSMIGFGLLVPPYAISAAVLHGIPKLFSRLWLTGVSDSRNETAKVLLLTLLSRVLPATLLAIAVILTMSMATTVGFVPTLVVAILSVALGSINIWGIVKFYPLITRHSGFFILTYLMLVCVLTVFTVSIAHNMISSVSEFSEAAGPWVSVLGATALTTAVSALCVWDAARSMGTSAEIMETNDAFVIIQPQ